MGSPLGGARAPTGSTGPSRVSEVYSIDTPPPTVSGSLHVGHVFSYTHTDIIARLPADARQAVFYPIGWDDNGLPTERRVQNVLRRALRPVAALRPRRSCRRTSPANATVPISRRNFVELCQRLTADRRAGVRGAVAAARPVGRLVAALHHDRRRRRGRVSQRAFLRNLARGEAYLAEAPTLWDVTFRTAVAQAELEDREWPGAFHRISLPRPRRRPVWIETTRPELLPACVALVAHPDDERYQRAVRHHGAHAAVRRRGAGAGPPPGRARQGHGHRDGLHLRRPHRRDLVARAAPADPAGHRPGRPAAARAARGRRRPEPYAELAGQTVHSARERIVELLRESGDLDGEPRPVTHPVKFYEKRRPAAGDRHHPAVVHPQRRARRGAARAAAGAGRRAGLAPAAHAGPLRELGARA